MTINKQIKILYTIIIALAALQIVSIIIITFEISSIHNDLTSDITASQKNLTAYTNNLVEKYNEGYQANFNQITKTLSDQEANLKQEISLIKSAQDDFSGIANDAVKSVVTISTPKAAASGFIINPAGYIVTNYHVIAGGEGDISVVTYGKKRISATLIGQDQERDLALLKIAGTYLSLDLANSDNLQVGKKVIAIGNPLGLSFTVTGGIISALHRKGSNGLPEYIQTDVSLNPGNSGGPLIDTSGEVVGINNFKIGGAESLGFALESNIIREKVNFMANQTIVE
ncbi:MAG: trypsin-like peptidase domain-containing protein [Nanoarchaeota archaeon]|nr:trypsin-like peptidase domain-containing protein [Nanoarchaeota archaeon]